jgi:uncharacterized protein YecT (DUF1311 family)
MENDLNDRLLGDLGWLEKGQLPSYSHEDFLVADGALNAEYGRVMADLNKALAAQEDPYCPVSTRPETLRDAERAWIAYRDAWVAFARVRWPQVSADSWRTYLTLARTEDIHAVDEPGN